MIVALMFPGLNSNRPFFLTWYYVGVFDSREKAREVVRELSKVTPHLDFHVSFHETVINPDAVEYYSTDAELERNIETWYSRKGVLSCE